jgi:hypothetical protein
MWKTKQVLLLWAKSKLNYMKSHYTFAETQGGSLFALSFPEYKWQSLPTIVAESNSGQQYSFS